MVSPQLSNRLGFINPGLTLLVYLHLSNSCSNKKYEFVNGGRVFACFCHFTSKCSLLPARFLHKLAAVTRWCLLCLLWLPHILVHLQRGYCRYHATFCYIWPALLVFTLLFQSSSSHVSFLGMASKQISAYRQCATPSKAQQPVECCNL